MEKMYSWNGGLPTPLPFRIRMPSGFTRTDPKTFTEEELAETGFVLVTQEKPLPGRYERVIWEDMQYKVVALSEQEKQDILNAQWKVIRKTRDQEILNNTWRIERYFSELRLGMEPKDDIKKLDNYIQALRDVTTQEDPFNIIWPQEEITQS